MTGRGRSVNPDPDHGFRFKWIAHSGLARKVIRLRPESAIRLLRIQRSSSSGICDPPRPDSATAVPEQTGQSLAGPVVTTNVAASVRARLANKARESQRATHVPQLYLAVPRGQCRARRSAVELRGFGTAGDASMTRPPPGSQSPSVRFPPAPRWLTFPHSGPRTARSSNEAFIYILSDTYILLCRTV